MCKSLAYLLLYFVYFMSMLLRSCCCKFKIALNKHNGDYLHRLFLLLSGEVGIQKNFHKYIIHWFKNDPEKYIRDYGRDYDQNASGYMAEPPKVHTRLGDYADIYVNWIPEENILDRKHYRAVHYIVVYRGVYIEIQIKTLFEEGWGEIDHSILYPRRKGNAMLTEFSELLNRLAGMGDEMGSFYRRLQVVPDEKFQSKETIVRKRELKPQVKAAVEKRDLNEIHTMDDAVWSILKE